MLKTPRYVALGAGVAAFASILGGGAFAASALGSTTTGTSVVAQTTPAPTGSTAPADRAAQQEAYLQALAGNLGIDEATLKAALQKTSVDQIAQMVADGTLTQDQADQITAEIQNGGHLFFGLEGPGRGGPGDHGRPGGPGMDGDHAAEQAALADFLGVDTATLQSEFQSGTTLADVAANHGKTRDELKAFLTDQEATELATAVADGRLTQAQADQIAADHAANLDARIDGTFDAHGPGMRGGPGGPPPANGSSTTPTTN